MEAQASRRAYPCSYCHDVMSSRQTLLRHKRRKHPVEILSENNEAKKSLLCRDCDFRCLMTKTLIQHYKYHGRKLTVREKTFANEGEFVSWKKDVEKKTQALFVLHRGRRETQRTFVKNYYCNRSGFFVPCGKGKRVRMKMSSKINYTCSGYMRVECFKFSGAVKVEYCLDHTHELDKPVNIDSGHIRLSNRLQTDIASELGKPLKIEIMEPSARDLKTAEEIVCVTETEVLHSSSNVCGTGVIHINSNSNAHDKNFCDANHSEEGSVVCSYDDSNVYENDESNTYESCSVTQYSNETSACFTNDQSSVIVCNVPLMNNASLDYSKREMLKMMAELVNIVTHTSSSDTLMNIRKHILAAHTVGKNLHSIDTDHNYERIWNYQAEDSDNWECCIKIKKEN